MKIKTTAENGHLRVYLYNSADLKIITLYDNDEKDVMLMPNTAYTMEYHYWSPNPAKYSIISDPPFDEYPDGIVFDLPAAAEDDNIIDITT